MALSNWDTLAIDQDGNPSNGEFVASNGASVEIYKNWLYLRDPKAWHDTGGYITPTIASIRKGEITYGYMTIHAKRSPSKQGVLIAVVEPAYKRDDKTEKAMFGIGCYGFMDTSVSYTDYDHGAASTGWRSEIESSWVGVENEDVMALKAFIAELCSGQDIDERYMALDFSKALRFNQGDAYFAACKEASIPATKPGSAGEPILMQILEKDAE